MSKKDKTFDFGTHTITVADTFGRSQIEIFNTETNTLVIFNNKNNRVVVIDGDHNHHTF